MTRVIDVRLPAIPASVPAARGLVDDLAGEVDPQGLQDILIMVSELVTNSVRHAKLAPPDRVHLLVERLDDRVRVSVADAGPGFGTPPGPTEEGLSGWGLDLVDRLAARWGHERAPGRNTVWFETRARARVHSNR
jgi:anti-sigma regulatory factor (Ser/Thr protein kinase)